jgi:hypothetical protein
MDVGGSGGEVKEKEKIEIRKSKFEGEGGVGYLNLNLDFSAQQSALRAPLFSIFEFRFSNFPKGFTFK